MSSILLMTSNSAKFSYRAKEENKKEYIDNGTCLNCKYQGTGSENCKKCKRGTLARVWKKPYEKDYFLLRKY